MARPTDFRRDERIPGAFDGSWSASGPALHSYTPIDGELLAEVTAASASDADRVIVAAREAFFGWREVPAPARAEVVRRLGVALREAKEELAQLVTLEMGKILSEARGEVQEMIDVCDFAVGLGRQLGGRTLPSERAGHRLMEQWHPLGVAGVVTSFNFPVAVWAWNAALALVCGDTVVWKPSSKTPLTAIAVTRIAAEVLSRCGHPGAVLSLAVGSGSDVGERLVADRRVALVSYTGSVATGRRVGARVQERFGRSLLELGGNNAAIIAPSADLGAAIEAVLFGAVGTAGQRCTSTRRLIVHESLAERALARLVELYPTLPIGDPRDEATLVGPLIDREAVAAMQRALEAAVAQGGRVLVGGQPLPRAGGCYAAPCVVEARPGMDIVQEETFAPVLYVLRYRTIDEAIAIQNDVPQGLSSAIFSNDLAECERFLSASGSDCGLANVNTSTSGAEIGGAFGGEKETGGGRESGSDSWKAYMRRQTSVVNSSGRIALAQGVRFDAARSDT
jgi:aldehyde dehydrogenase (NAD+)